MINPEPSTVLLRERHESPDEYWLVKSVDQGTATLTCTVTYSVSELEALGFKSLSLQFRERCLRLKRETMVGLGHVHKGVPTNLNDFIILILDVIQAVNKEDADG